MRVLVVGAGAVGGYFGARLAKAGRDVTFLVRPARAAQLQRDGLQIVTPDDQLTVRPNVVLAKDLTAHYDLVLLGVKAYGLAAAMDDFAPAVGPETTVLPLLNGIRHLDILAARFGDSAVIGGSTQISTDVDSEGRIHRLTPLQDLVFGERNGAVTSRIERVMETLHDAGFKDELSRDITTFLWQKWTLLSALAALTCLFRSSIGEIAAVPRGLAVANGMLDETASIVKAEGHPASAAFLDTARKRLTEAGSPLTASMFRDMQRGSPVEVEHVIGDLLSRGEAHGLDTPLLRAAYVHLAAYQARLEQK